MKLTESLAKLRELANASTLAHNAKADPGVAQIGVKLGDIRVLAKAIKLNQPLAFELWQTEILDARLLAILLLKPKDLTLDELERFVRSNNSLQVADWLSAYILKQHPDKEMLRERCMASDHPMAYRAGWSLTAERVSKSPAGLDLSGLLDRLELEMPNAPAVVQWTMNNTLAAIGIHHPTHRARAINLGEAMGIYRDFPVSKGCTSPFAPIWINEMVSRQG